MITFDSLTLKAWIKENKNFLEGARIQKIQQPTRRDFVLTLRSSGETRKLYININPQYYHVCFMSKDNETRRLIEIPQKPPMFCMQLRKYLENAKISKVNQPEYERILEFYIETYNELSEKIYLCLAVELMGKHSNVVLYSYDTNIILGCAHNVGAEKSREREMAGTLPYIYPPKQKKLDILTYNGAINYETLNSDFYWFSNAFAEQVKNQPLENLKNYISLKNISPAISKDYKSFSLFSELLGEPLRQEAVNSMIDNYYTYYQEKEMFKNLKSHLASIVKGRLKKTKSSLDKMLFQIKSSKDADKYRLYGDLIMANLYNSKDFSKNISVYDYENDRDITISIDETKTLKENANKFYKQYTKSKTQCEKLKELSRNLKQTKDYLEQVLYSIESAEKIQELIEISSEVTEKKASQKVLKSEPLMIQLQGAGIYIGKNNRQNDYIVSKLAKDEDIWFHVKDCAGSHVLLKSDNPTDEMILACAKLAKEHSTVSKTSKVGVIYTKRKYLRKPPKANLGYVTYREEKEIVID